MDLDNKKMAVLNEDQPCLDVCHVTLFVTLLWCFAAGIPAL